MMDTSGVEDNATSTKKQKHGLACVPCATAKTKCLRSAASSSCDRCSQLRKQCTSQTPMPRKRKAGPPTTTRVAQLEQKLDGLVTLLTSQQVAATEEGNSANDLPSFRQPRVSNHLPTPDGFALTNNKNNDYVSPLSEERCATSTQATGSVMMDTARLSRRTTVSEASSLQVEDGRLLLDIFYTRQLPYFPFAVLEPDDTVDKLRNHKPFLWKVIQCIASTRDLSRQESLGAEIMQEITSKLLLSTSKSLELLQGLLIFGAWNHYQFTVNGQMSTLMYLAKSLTTNLGLDRAPGAVDRRAQWMNGNPLRCRTETSSDSRIHTLAEQRAFLICYYLVSSRVKLGGSNADIFHYTPYIEKCCQSLEATQECKSDLLLVYLVRILHIGEEITQTFPYDEVETYKALGTPVALCIKALLTKLSTLRSSLPSKLEHNPMWLMTYHSAELSLYEIALYDVTEVETRNSTFHLQLDRLGLLHGCLESLVAYFAIYTNLPKEDVVAFPFTIWMQSGLAVLTAIELAFLRLDGWDIAQTRDSIDISGIIDREIEILDDIAAKRRLHPLDDIKKDIFWRFAQRMRKTRSLYDSKMNVELKMGTQQGKTSDKEIDMTATLDGILAGDLLNGWDESFWQTFVSDQWDDVNMLGNGLS